MIAVILAVSVLPVLLLMLLLAPKLLILFILGTLAWALADVDRPRREGKK